MRTLIVVSLAIAACAPVETGSGSATATPMPSFTAPTPALATGPAIQGTEPPATAPACDATMSARPSGPLVVVLADGEREGTALLVELGFPDRLVGTVRLGYQPVVAVDGRNRQLLAICSPVDRPTSAALVAYSLDDLSVRWRVPLAERIMTKVAAAPSVLPSVDGRYVFTYHYRTLRPGDGNAPGNTRYWVGVRDARTGALLREVDTPQCGVALFHQATSDLLYLGCGLGGHVRALRTDTWQEALYFATSVPRLAALSATGERYVIVTHDQWVLAYDAASGRQLLASHWSDTATPTVPFFGRLAMSPDGSEVWIPHGEPSLEVRPGIAISHINLKTGTRTTHVVAELGAVMNAHGRVLFVGSGRLGVLAPGRLLDLGVRHRVVAWSILAVP